MTMIVLGAWDQGRSLFRDENATIRHCVLIIRLGSSYNTDHDERKATRFIIGAVITN
jgi:hypothetical protein